MRLRKSKIVIIVSLIVICMNNISLSKYRDFEEYFCYTLIAKPIIVIEKDDMLKQEINKNSFPIEYNFCVNNFNESEINEIECEYVIKVENSVDNFPIKYKLIDCDNEREIALVDGTSEKISMKKSEKESRKFQLILNWKEIDAELAEKLEVTLKIEVVQIKKGGK